MVGDILVYAGLVLIGIGTLWLLWNARQPPVPVAQEAVDPAKLLEEIRKILDGVEQRYRVPLILVFVGLTVAILGVYLKVLDAKNAAEHAKAIAGFP